MAAVFNFLEQPENVLSTPDAVILHDKAPGWKAIATQEVLATAPCDFFKSTEWPAASPDLNACEHLGSVLKEKVEVKMLSERGGNKTCMTRLKKHITATLQELEYDTELFQALLTSYPRRIEAVKNAEGGHTDY